MGRTWAEKGRAFALTLTYPGRLLLESAGSELLVALWLGNSLLWGVALSLITAAGSRWVKDGEK